MGALLLLVTAAIWGAAFLAQKLGGEEVGPFAFTSYRSILAAAFLLVVMAITKRRNPLMLIGKREIIGGIWCGIALFVASALQQIGIESTSPGTCAFLTTNYVLFVPIFAIFLGRRLRWFVWVGVVLALVGTYLICVRSVQDFAIGRGELLTIACAAMFAVQILVVDHWVKGTDIVAMSCVQFATVAVCGLPFLALPSETAKLSWGCIMAAGGAIAFCGILSSGVAYTLQNVAQGRVQPALASIIMSLESVFGVTFSWMFGHFGWLGMGEEPMSARRLIGYAFVFAAVIFTQLAEHFYVSGLFGSRRGTCRVTE